MAKPTYWELLKHPHWQRKRLEILERANFQCEDCGAEDRTLHVHHAYYERGLKPWEYPSNTLHCLCEVCHAKTQDLMTLLNRTIGDLSGGDLARMYGYAIGLRASAMSTVVDVLSYEMAEGIGDSHGLIADEVIRALSEQSIDSEGLYYLREAKRKGK